MTKEDMERQWRAPGVLCPSNRTAWVDRGPLKGGVTYRAGVWVCAASKETLARVKRDFPNCYKEMVPP